MGSACPCARSPMTSEGATSTTWSGSCFDRIISLPSYVADLSVILFEADGATVVPDQDCCPRSRESSDMWPPQCGIRDHDLSHGGCNTFIELSRHFYPMSHASTTQLRYTWAFSLVTDQPSNHDRSVQSYSAADLHHILTIRIWPPQEARA